MAPISLDATYSFGDELSGVGIYSREILFGLTSYRPDHRFRFYYRPHRLLRSWKERLPDNCSRRLLLESSGGRALFHGLNQRMPRGRFHRSVCTFHDLFVLTGEYSTADFRRRFADQARQAAEQSDRIVCVSQFTANQVHELLGVERARLRVIHHGIRALPHPRVERQPLVFSVGAIQTRKNTARLVRAFERLPEGWRLVLAGSVSGFGAEETFAAIEQSPVRDRIDVTGYISIPRLAELYASASIFAFPSLDEGFGMPVLEAMAAGVPVLASNTSAMPEVCDTAAIYVNPLSTDEIGAALLNLALNQELRQDLAAQGKLRAAQFNWTRTVEQTWDLYCELLS